MKQSNKKTVESQVSQAQLSTTAQPTSIRWQFTVISDRDANGNPSATEYAQFMALPGIPLAREAIARYLRTAASQGSTSPTAVQSASQPILKDA